MRINIFKGRQSLAPGKRKRKMSLGGDRMGINGKKVVKAETQQKAVAVSGLLD